MSKPLIEFKDATLGHEPTAVLSGVGLAVDAGAFVGILGRNGSGKTTLLKTILGLIPVLAGRLETRGAGLAVPRFGYVPQKERLDPIYPLSAYDVAALGTYRRLELFQSLRRDHRPLIEGSLAACGASALAERSFSDLSGGQKQRVLIARALAAEPEILALDEPLSGIDAATQHALITLLKGLKDERGLTVLMVSHRVRVEKDLFSHVVCCDEGRAVMGTSEEMLATGRLAEMFKGEL